MQLWQRADDFMDNVTTNRQKVVEPERGVSGQSYSPKRYFFQLFYLEDESLEVNEKKGKETFENTFLQAFSSLYDFISLQRRLANSFLIGKSSQRSGLHA